MPSWFQESAWCVPYRWNNTYPYWAKDFTGTSRTNLFLAYDKPKVLDLNEIKMLY